MQTNIPGWEKSQRHFCSKPCETFGFRAQFFCPTSTVAVFWCAGLLKAVQVWAEGGQRSRLKVNRLLETSLDRLPGSVLQGSAWAPKPLSQAWKRSCEPGNCLSWNIFRHFWTKDFSRHTVFCYILLVAVPVSIEAWTPQTPLRALLRARDLKSILLRTCSMDDRKVGPNTNVAGVSFFPSSGWSGVWGR